MILLSEDYTKLQSFLAAQFVSQEAFIDFVYFHKILNKFKFPTDSKELQLQLRTSALTSLLNKSYQEIVRLFFVNQIPLIPLKGLFFHQFSPNYAITRDTRDIDILIKQDDLTQAITILVSAGWEVQAPSNNIRRKINEYLLHAITLKHHTGVELDLHWRLAEIFHLSPNFTNDYFRTALPASGENSILIPNPNMQILFLALHASKDHWQRAYYLFDLNYLMTTTNVDLHEISKLSRKYGINKIYQFTMKQYQVFTSIFLENDDRLANEKLLDLFRGVNCQELSAYFLWSDHSGQAIKKCIFRYLIPFGNDLLSNENLFFIFIKKYLRLMSRLSSNILAQIKSRF